MVKKRPGHKDINYFFHFLVISNQPQRQLPNKSKLASIFSIFLSLAPGTPDLAEGTSVSNWIKSCDTESLNIGIYVVIEAREDNDWEDVLAEQDHHGEARLHDDVRPVLHTHGEGRVQNVDLLKGLERQDGRRDEEGGQPDGEVDQEDALPGELPRESYQ